MSTKTTVHVRGHLADGTTAEFRISKNAPPLAIAIQMSRKSGMVGELRITYQREGVEFGRKAVPRSWTITADDTPVETDPTIRTTYTPPRERTRGKRPPKNSIT